MAADTSSLHRTVADRDIVIIGGGAAGLSAARTAKHEGASVTLISDAPLGGDCTFTGCVPSKTLIEAASRAETFADGLDQVHQTIAAIAATENAEVLRDEGIDVRRGRAQLRGAGRVVTDAFEVRADHVFIATGSHPLVPRIEGLTSVHYHTNESFFDLRPQPARLAIVGGGPIGCEMAQAMARFGSEVHLFERSDRLLAGEERQASEIVADALGREGVTVHLGSQVTGISAREAGAVVHADGVEIPVDELLVAVGRRPNTAALGLDAAGVAVTDRGWVQVDEYLRTTADGLWAIGDVNGLMPLTHAADEQGRLAAWSATRRRKYRFDASLIPSVVFTSPEVARVGVVERDARRSARVAELPMAENDRARTAGRTQGYVKLIAAPRPVLRNLGGGALVGATIVGDRAGEMIHEPALAMRTGMFVGRLAQMAHAYPTWSVGVQKAAGQFFMPVEGRKPRTPRR